MFHCFRGFTHDQSVEAEQVSVSNSTSELVLFENKIVTSYNMILDYTSCSALTKISYMKLVSNSYIDTKYDTKRDGKRQTGNKLVNKRRQLELHRPMALFPQINNRLSTKQNSDD